jgi:signal transduction histidine kinase
VRGRSWIVVGVSFLLAASGLGLYVPIAGDVPAELRLSPPQLILDLAWLAYGPLGALILAHRRRHLIGVILVATGLLAGVGLAVVGLLSRQYASGHLGSAIGEWYFGSVWVLVVAVPLTFIPLLFPDGHLPGSRWRPWAFAAAAAIVLQWAGFAFADGEMMDPPHAVNPIGVPGARTLQFAILLTPGLIGLGGAAVWRRWRRGEGEERQQLRWLGYAACLSLLALVATTLPGDWGPVPALFMLVPVLGFPMVVTLAITRHHLYDIDPVINRSLVYGVLAAIVLACYAVVVLVAGHVISEPLSSRQAALATALIAVAVHPLHGVVQRRVNRLLYGGRDNPYAAMSRLAERLSDAAAPLTLLDSVAETIATELRLPFVAIEVGPPPGRVIASYGEPGPRVQRRPLVHQGATLGFLLLCTRGPGDELTPTHDRLLDDVARQTALAVHAHRLSEDLKRARGLLVRAREEERRRLRRDLHDGLGPTLAGIVLKAGNGRRLTRGPVSGEALLEVRALLASIENSAQAAVSDVRRVVNGLRPPTLDELGLVGALEAFAANLPLPTQVRTSGVPVLSAATEAAAYRIVAEAMTNAARHSRGSRCVARIDVLDGHLDIEVSDDGCGLSATHSSGVGMLSMAERAEELGGWCVVDDAPSSGTVVRSWLPTEPR